jgi:hypothetical protein
MGYSGGMSVRGAPGRPIILQPRFWLLLPVVWYFLPNLFVLLSGSTGGW